MSFARPQALAGVHPDTVRIVAMSAAIALNAAANGVSVSAATVDVTGAACRWDLILCGDVCYEAPMTAHILPWLKQMAREAEVWLADPGRAMAESFLVAAAGEWELGAVAHRGPATVTVQGSAFTVSNIVVVNATTITATIHVGSSASRRSHNLTVATGAGTSNAISFTVQ